MLFLTKTKVIPQRRSRKKIYFYD